MKLYCYLAGPVEFSDKNEDWRENITTELGKIGIKSLNPIIKPDWLLPQGEKPPVLYGKEISKQLFVNNSYNHEDFEAMKYIREYCMQLINISDFIICRITKTPTSGTYEELGIIKNQNKPVFIWAPEKWLPGWVYAMFSDPFYFVSTKEHLFQKLDFIINNKDELRLEEKLKWLKLFLG